jgi:uncharacterized protein
MAVSSLGALLWMVLVSASPATFFEWATPIGLVWLAVSVLAAPPGLQARLRPTRFDLLLGLASGLAVYALSLGFVWATCGGVTDALCAPIGEVFQRFDTRAPLPALALFFVLAPAEELYWRGVLQPRLTARLGAAPTVIVATALAVLLALATSEPILALAIIPTYSLWGALTAWRNSLVPALVSHSVWTTLVAAIAPPM